MTQTLDKRLGNLNPGGGGGGGWASSAPLGPWTAYHGRRRGAPTYKRRYHHGPQAGYEPPRKPPKPPRGPWFQPRGRPSWSLCAPWGHWGGHWRPPPPGFRKAPGRAQLFGLCGLHPLCLCCCSCWSGPWGLPGWARPPWRKKRWGPWGRWGRWGRRGRGLRRQARRPVPRSPPVELGALLRPGNLGGWRAPGMRAPRNTTQFIMNQIYEDMRQQELERQRQAQGGSPGGGRPPNECPSGDEEDAELPEFLYSYMQNPSLAISPAPDQENPSEAPQLVEEEEEEKEGEEEEEEEEVEEEEEAVEEEEEEEVEKEEVEEEYDGEEEEEEEEEEDGEEEIEAEGLEEAVPREEDHQLPLEMPLSLLIEAEDERENFLNCAFLSPEQMMPELSQEALFMEQGMN